MGVAELRRGALGRAVALREYWTIVPRGAGMRWDFEPYVSTLVDIIASPETNTPVTIGVFGDWGAGKTTILKMIQGKLLLLCLVRRLSRGWVAHSG